MISAPCLRCCQARWKNPAPLYANTARVIGALNTCSSRWMLGSMPCRSPAYRAIANMPTCIMPKKATPSRRRSRWLSRRICTSRVSGRQGCAPYPNACRVLTTDRASASSRRETVNLPRVSCTFASSTSGCCRTKRSMIQAQAAQLIPVTSNGSCRLPSVLSAKLCSQFRLPNHSAGASVSSSGRGENSVRRW